MRKILQVLSDTNIGGAGRALLNYLENRDREAFSTVVAVPEGSFLIPSLRRTGAKIVEIPGMKDRSFSLRDILLLKQVIRKEKPDLVHTHGSFSGRIAASSLRVPVVMTRHCCFPLSAWQRTAFGKKISRWGYERFARRILCVSDAAKKNMTDLGVRESLLYVLYNGVPPVPAANRIETASLQKNRPGTVFGILGRLEPYKGHILLLQAMKELKERNEPCALLIAGSGTQEALLRRKTAEWGLSDRVEFLGFLDDVAPFFSTIDVQINASTGTETSSLSLLEGFSRGIPAIVSDFGGNPELVREGENGCVVPCGDPHALAEAMSRWIHAPEVRQQLGIGARTRYEEQFTAKHYAEILERNYRELMRC